MRHAIITGGAGFIGSHLVDRLLAEGRWRVTVIDNFDAFYARASKEANIRAHTKDPNFRLIEAGLLDEQLPARLGADPADVIVHIAAKAGVRPSISDPIAYHRTNVTGTLRMLELARHLKVPHFVLASSSSVYGLDPDVPWKEKEQGLAPISPYAATKIAAEQFAQVYARLHGLKVTVLRFFTVYGPRQRRSRDPSVLPEDPFGCTDPTFWRWVHAPGLHLRRRHHPGGACRDRSRAGRPVRDLQPR